MPSFRNILFNCNYIRPIVARAKSDQFGSCRRIRYTFSYTSN